MDQQSGRQGSGNHPIKTAKRNENLKKNGERDFWNNIKDITFTLQESQRRRKKVAGNLFEEIMAENFSSKKRPREEEKKT